LQPVEPAHESDGAHLELRIWLRLLSCATRIEKALNARLRKEFNMLPPGDVRNCIVALSEDSALLSKLFQHRFEKGTGLEGHSFGNLFLAALTSLTGDFSESVRLSSEILATRGHIYAATTANIELEALMQEFDQARLGGKACAGVVTGLAQLHDIAEKLLSNPVIEDFEVHVEEQSR